MGTPLGCKLLTDNITMSTCTIRTSKFITNALLGRRQMVVDIIHPGRASVPKTELREILAKKYGVSDINTIILFGNRIAFGGGRSRCFALIYDDERLCVPLSPTTVWSVPAWPRP